MHGFDALLHVLLIVCMFFDFSSCHYNAQHSSSCLLGFLGELLDCESIHYTQSWFVTFADMTYLLLSLQYHAHKSRTLYMFFDRSIV